LIVAVGFVAASKADDANDVTYFKPAADKQLSSAFGCGLSFDNRRFASSPSELVYKTNCTLQLHLQGRRRTWSYQLIR
jgi:hypothetical protein